MQLEIYQLYARLGRRENRTHSSRDHETKEEERLVGTTEERQQVVEELAFALARKEKEIAQLKDEATERERKHEVLYAKWRTEGEKKNIELDVRAQEIEEIRIAAKAKDDQIEAAIKKIDELTLDHEKLVNCFEETVTEIRTISEEKAEKENVKMTEIKLGEGAYGEVRVGYWRGCPVAVKIFYEFLNTENSLRLFQEEIAVCSRIRHPNIVSLCGATTEKNERLRIITELLEGSLSDVIIAARRSKWLLSLREQIDLAFGMTAATTYLHELRPNGVVHGNIRSSNVVVTALMEAKLCDLGGTTFAQVSLSTVPLPASQYSAPEQGSVLYQGTQMTDVCSLGVTLAELMTGEEPVASQRFEQASIVGHPLVKKMCLQMISIDPSVRPTAHECLDTLERVKKSDDYNQCYPKRVVKGKLHGEVSLVFPHLPHCLSVQPGIL
ncbi:probable serine/threonine-protein kinase DDB_G0281745 isoform X4 [Oscarella lobularis]